jgi:transposase-like protein
MGLVYLINIDDYKRVKVGCSIRDILTTYRRYCTSFGGDVKFVYFNVDNPLEAEHAFKFHFREMNITNELYKKEYFDEYVMFFESLSKQKYKTYTKEDMVKQQPKKEKNIKLVPTQETHKGVIIEENYLENLQQYICPRCHYECGNKNQSHFKRHLERRNACAPIFSSISPENILSDLYNIMDKARQYKCSHCDKAFAHQRSLTFHIKQAHSNQENACSNAETNVTAHNRKFQDVVKETPFIELNSFGQEDISYIYHNQKDIINSLNDNVLLCITDIVREIYIKIPKNTIIKFQREHYPALLQVYENNEWIAKDAYIVVQAILNKIVDILLTISKEDTIRTQLMDIKKLRRGVYAPLRNNIITLFKESSKKS